MGAGCILIRERGVYFDDGDGCMVLCANGDGCGVHFDDGDDRRAHFDDGNGHGVYAMMTAMRVGCILMTKIGARFIVGKAFPMGFGPTQFVLSRT